MSEGRKNSLNPDFHLLTDVFAYTGLYTGFKKAGFIEVARRSETRPVMRYFIKKD